VIESVVVLWRAHTLFSVRPGTTSLFAGWWGHCALTWRVS